MVDIGALFGGGGVSLPTIPALATFKSLVKTENLEIQKYSKTAPVQKDLAYFQAKIGKVTSVDQLVKDPCLLKVIATAYGVEGDLNAPAKLKAVLTSDLSDNGSFANRLIDPRYKKFAAAFDTKINGMTRFKDAAVISNVVTKYVSNAYEKSLGDKNPALREATYFLRNIGNITDTYQILGDKVLRAVVVDALGLPPNIAVQSVEKQKQLIEAKLGDVLKFRATPVSKPGDAPAPKSPTDIANDELNSLVSTRSAATNAQAALKSIADRIQSVQDDYARLANIQNPAGPYAAEIPVQQAAAPDLIRQRGLLAAGQNAMNEIAGYTNRLTQLVQVVGDPANAANLAEYQVEFQDLHDKIGAAIANANYNFDDPTAGANFTTQNLLTGTLTSPITVTYNAAGDQTSIRSFDLSASSAYQAQLDAANNAFQAITGSGDAAHIVAAASATTGAKTISDQTNATVSVDSVAFATAIGSVKQWAGTFDTTQLYPGAESLRDAGARVAQVNILVGQIRATASISAQMSDGVARQAVLDQYADLTTQLSNVVNTTNNSTADNLLAGATQDYQLATDTYLRARGRDLNTTVASILSAGDISDAAGANAVLAQIDGGVKTALAQTSRELGVDSQAFGLAADTLDPRAKVDGSYRKLATDIDGLAATGLSGQTNLLDPDQAAVVLKLTSIGRTLTISPETGFDVDVNQALNAGSELLPSDNGDTSGALAALETARFNVQRVLGNLNGDVRNIDNARNALNQKITDMQTKAAASGTGVDTAFANASKFAIQFIERYLAKKDAENAASGAGLGGAGGGNAYLLQLIQPLGKGGVNTIA